MKTALVYIDNTEVALLQNSIRVNLRIEARSIAAFTIVDTAGSASYQKGQRVLVHDLTSISIPGDFIDVVDEIAANSLTYDTPDTRLFSGFIDSVESMRVTPSGAMYHKIICVDNHYLADKRLVAESYTDKTAKYIVEDISSTYLSDEGVEDRDIQTGPTIKEAIFNYVSVSDCFDALAEQAGFIWEIDENKKLYFIDRSTNAAPWAFTNLKAINTPALTGGNPLYRNSQYIRGGKGTTSQQTANFTGAGVAQSVACSFPMAKVPAVTVDGNVQTVGIKGLDTAKDCYWSKNDPIIAFDTAPGNTLVVVITYYGLFDILTLAENTNEIEALKAMEGGGTGYVDAMDSEPKLTDSDAVMDAGEAKLSVYAGAGKRFAYKTTDGKLKPGQLQSITYSPFGFSGEDMLIESVIITADGEFITYDVTAIQGPSMGGWSNLFKRLAQATFDTVNIGSNQLLIILKKEAEKWAWSESVDKTVFACSVPSATLYPSPTLYPC